VLYSIFLAFLSALVIEAFCLFCAGLYVINFAIAGIGWYKPPTRPRFFETLGSDLRLLLTGFSAWKVQAALVAALLGAVVLAQFGAHLRAAGGGEVIGQIGSRRLIAAPGHSDGYAGAPLVVVGFSDFECSHCAAASLMVDRLRREIGSSVGFVFKHFPLDASCNRAIPRNLRGRRSCAAAVGAVCAGEQGRFWEYQERIFERGTSAATMRHTVGELGLDVAEWQRCLSSMRAASVVRNDIEDGLAIGVQSTPTFLIGDKVQRGGLPYDRMLRLIRTKLQAANEAAQGS
jgi:protein-disulfide isomerase